MTENKDLQTLVAGKAVEGRLACAVAHSLARELGVSPAEVGQAADEAEVRLNRCQMGLFGYYPQKRIVVPAQTVDHHLEKAIRSALSNGRLACASAWEIAKQLGVARMEVAGACEAMGIKISACQLGAF